MVDANEFERHLKREDSVSLPYRITRLRFLVEEFGEPRYIGVPQMAFFYIEEAKTCYLNGAFVACVLVAQAALEDMLRWTLTLLDPQLSGRKLASMKFKQVINLWHAKELLSEEEAEGLHRIRETRNPYVHTKEITHARGFLRRSQQSDFTKDEWDLMIEDAERALKCLFHLLSRFPFTFP